MCCVRAVLSGSVGVHFPVAGSYSSALLRAVGTSLEKLNPPATSTWPEAKSVAVWSRRPVSSEPTAIHRPWAAASLIGPASALAAHPTSSTSVTRRRHAHRLDLIAVSSDLGVTRIGAQTVVGVHRLTDGSASAWTPSGTCRTS